MDCGRPAAITVGDGGGGENRRQVDGHKNTPPKEAAGRDGERATMLDVPGSLRSDGGGVKLGTLRAVSAAYASDCDGFCTT